VLQRIAVTADPWPSGYALGRSDDGESFAPEQTVTTRAMIGVTASTLPAGPLWRMDRRSQIEVTLSHGQLQSVGEVASLAGLNLLAVESPQQGWEVLSFANAELTGLDTWRLSGLVRGLGGSELLAGLLKPPGSRVVLLDGAVQPLATGLEALGRRSFWRIAPLGRDHADTMAIAFAATPGPAALLPLAPVHLKARRGSDGVTLSWVRRTRTGGDNLALAEVPLGEAREAYLAEVLSGDSVKRRFETSQPSVLYPASAEIADFGTAQSDIRLRIRQVSAAAGPGHAAERLIPIN
jgi:hypothetical protein